MATRLKYFLSRMSSEAAPQAAPESLNKSHIDLLLKIPDAWMLRECQCYYDELNACNSMKGRFYQYYHDGKMGDCSNWQENHADCKVKHILSTCATEGFKSIIYCKR